MKKTQKNAREQQNSNKIRQEEEINAYNSCEIIKKTVSMLKQQLELSKYTHSHKQTHLHI